MTAYKQVFEDHSYLWKIAPPMDMTGGYVDQDDLDKLLKSPTKVTARDCLTSQIAYWFEVGPEKFDYRGSFEECCQEYPRVLEIQDRYAMHDYNWQYVSRG